MEINEGIEWVDQYLLLKSEKPLTETDKVLFTAGWLDYKYCEAAENFDFSAGYLQSIGPVLWRKLSFILGTKVTKKTLRSVVEQLASGSDPNLAVIDSEISQSSNLRLLGRRPPATDKYFGYTPELEFLKQSVSQAQCVVLFGQAGIGKSSLASKLIESLQRSSKPSFDLVIWQTIHVHADLDSLLDDIFRCLELTSSNSKGDRNLQIRELIQIFNQQRCLIVLDGAEEILKGRTKTNLYGENEPYRTFFQEMIGQNHSSCLLLTTREPFRDLSLAKEMGQSVRIIEINGLGQDATDLLKDQGLVDQHDALGYLIHKYRGNPLSLKLVSHQIKRFFGGHVQAFLDCDTTWLGEPLEEALKAQFTSGFWSNLQRRLIHYLAVSLDTQESLLFSDVFEALHSQDESVSMSGFIEAIDTLYNRFLLESREVDGEVRLSLQPVIRKYLLTHPSEEKEISESLAA